MKTLSPLTPTALLAALAGSALGQSIEPFPAVIELSSLLPSGGGDGTNGFVLNGVDLNDFVGDSVSSAGDVNGDGIDDLLIGAFFADLNGALRAGRSYVVFGAVGVGAGGVIELSSLDGTNGFVLNGIDAYDFSGHSVSSAGDVNGDGIDDLIIGARHAGPNGFRSGESYVVFGAAGLGAGGVIELSSLNGTNGFVINGIHAYDRSGVSVSSAGDVNGDGIDDLVIASWVISRNSNAYGASDSYVVFGAAGVGSGGVIELSSLNGTDGFVLKGITGGGYHGTFVSCSGDVNGDGFDDLIIGTPSKSFVVFGAGGVGSGGVVELSSLNGTSGFALDRGGRSVSSAGDVNGDGIDDLIVGELGASPNGITQAGESYVVFGSLGVGSGGVIELSSLNGNNGFVINGIDMRDFSGASVSSAGDVNGDGIDDLIIGAFFADPNGKDSAGESYVVFGGAGVGASGTLELSSLNGTNGFVLNGIRVRDQSGISVSCAGDVNGDGIDDVIIGADDADPNGIVQAGQSYVIFGRSNGQRWISPTGGNWDTGSKWQEGIAPEAGIATIDTPIGVTVNGPSGAVFLKGLLLKASMGQTTLDLQATSLVSVVDPFDLPASGALRGAGTFISNALFTNNGLIEPSNLVIIANNGLSNNAEINLQTLSLSDPAVRFDLFGSLTNETGAEILIEGVADLKTTGGLTNIGTTSIAFASANLAGPVTNAGIPDGLGGFNPLGLISISGASQAVLAGDVLNQSEIVLTPDSSLVILGSLTGNGISGPGGGAAGTIFINGGINPGFAQATGIASFGGDLHLGSTNLTTIEIGGRIAGAEHDQVAGLANLGAGGTLQVMLVGGFTPSPGDEYQVLDFASITGSFGNIILDQALVDANADTSKLLTMGIIIIPALCVGDGNGDGVVNFVDITAVFGNWLNSYTPGTGPGDANGDGEVNFADITGVLSNWQAVCH